MQKRNLALLLAFLFLVIVMIGAGVLIARSLGKGGGKVAARKPGEGALAPIESAPGSYVLMRNDDA